MEYAPEIIGIVAAGITLLWGGVGALTLRDRVREMRANDPHLTSYNNWRRGSKTSITF